MSSEVRHIAIIMDGNGRWAQGRRHTRIFGHIRGAKRVREITEACTRRGIQALTLYTFSTENWQRPKAEVDTLMKLLFRYVRQERNTILKNNIRFQCLGFTDQIPDWVRVELEYLIKESSTNTGMVLNLALSYGSRQEITKAVRDLSADVAAGSLSPEGITEDMISRRLFTGTLPDPDLLIRTGGDQRISNFLLWQCAYAELYFTDVPWPEFSEADLDRAIQDYTCRERRYGLTSSQVTGSEDREMRSQ